MLLFYLKYLFILYFFRTWLAIMLEGASKSLRRWGGAWSKKKVGKHCFRPTIPNLFLIQLVVLGINQVNGKFPPYAFILYIHEDVTYKSVIDSNERNYVETDHHLMKHQLLAFTQDLNMHRSESFSLLRPKVWECEECSLHHVSQPVLTLWMPLADYIGSVCYIKTARAEEIGLKLIA
jgi:hypothetical protein